MARMKSRLLSWKASSPPTREEKPVIKNPDDTGRLLIFLSPNGFLAKIFNCINRSGRSSVTNSATYLIKVGRNLSKPDSLVKLNKWIKEVIAKLIWYSGVSEIDDL